MHWTAGERAALGWREQVSRGVEVRWGSVFRIPRVTEVGREDVKWEREEVEEMGKRQFLRTRFSGPRSSESTEAQGKPLNAFKQMKEMITPDFEKRHTLATTWNVKIRD